MEIKTGDYQRDTWKELECPVCGYEARDSECVKVQVNNRTTYHCMPCLGELVRTNVPVMKNKRELL